MEIDNLRSCDLCYEELIAVGLDKSFICFSCEKIVELHSKNFYNNFTIDEEKEIKAFLCLNYCTNKILKNQLKRSHIKTYQNLLNKKIEDLACKFDSIIKTKNRDKIILEKELNDTELQLILLFCQNQIYSSTRLKILNEFGLNFDSIIGQGKNKVYKVYVEKTKIYKACKLFNNPVDFIKEYFNYEKFKDCKVVIKLTREDIINVYNPTEDVKENPDMLGFMLPIITPFMDCIRYEFTSLSNSLSSKMLNAMIIAAEYANSINMAICDIKPENSGIDIDGNSYIFDLCAAEKLGNDIREFSPNYQLDDYEFNDKVSEVMDLNSIALSAVWAADNNYYRNFILQNNKKIKHIHDEAIIRKDQHIGWEIAAVFTKENRNIKSCYEEAQQLFANYI